MSNYQCTMNNIPSEIPLIFLKANIALIFVKMLIPYVCDPTDPFLCTMLFIVRDFYPY